MVVYASMNLLECKSQSENSPVRFRKMTGICVSIPGTGTLQRKGKPGQSDLTAGHLERRKSEAGDEGCTPRSAGEITSPVSRSSRNTAASRRQ